jgi:sucrose-6-phosphate hydrolase SacC (GH32 family)
VLVLWETDEWAWIRGDADQLQRMPVDVNSMLHEIKSSWRSALDMQIQTVVDSKFTDPQQVVELQVFVDGSSVEVFSSSGKAASTRVYGNSGGTLHAVSCGGGSNVTGALWPMKSCWKDV